MPDLLRTILFGQYEASLCMLRHAIAAVPGEHWESNVANGSVRWVAYHTLFFADFYLSPSEAEFQRRDLHALGGSELSDDAAPGLDQAEALRYADLCHAFMLEVIGTETAESLAAADGFGRNLTRGEMHVYNIRHIQHHAGQLSAFVRRVNPNVGHRDLPWIGHGWRGSA